MTDASRLLFGGVAPHSREDFQRAVLRLCEPFVDTDGFARQLAAVSHPAAHYSPRAARVELLARLLWGVAPLEAGGCSYPGWAPIRAEIVSGTDPDDPGFWGLPGAHDQRVVEAAALGVALALCPRQLWEPLSEAQRSRLADWLRSATRARVGENNWRLFATLINLGLRAVGEQFDAGITDAAFKRIDDFYHGGGWYSDGDRGAAVDHYGPWAIHFYSLINVARGGVGEPVASTAKERARQFAQEYVHWFAADGAGLPIGRSLTYRFAQAAFFGGLAFADDEPGLPWGELRGLWARHLRWWGSQAVLNGDGTLSIGYGYPSLIMSEHYNAPGSPYWAFKAFLPLALPATHPFWTHPELPQRELPASHAQPVAGLLLERDGTGHVTALAAAPGGGAARHREAKYAKFAYSTAFGFAVPTRALQLEGAGGDATLALGDDGRHWRVREEHESWSVDAQSIRARWQPWPNAEIDTWLVPLARWHVRAHRIRTSRALHTAEGAFCVPHDETALSSIEEHSALASAGDRTSAISDLTGKRRGEIVYPDPNGHLLWPRTLLPTLRGELEPGEHWLVSAVYAAADGDTQAAASPPSADRLGALPDEALRVIVGQA